MENNQNAQKITASELKHLIMIGVMKAFETVDVNASFDLDKDYYWEIDYEDFFDVTNLQTELTVGSLYDDLDELRKIKDGGAFSALHIRKLRSILMFLFLQIS